MKSIILRAGVLTCLILVGWAFDKAEAATTWPSQCTQLGAIPSGQTNPSPQQINCLLTNAALDANIPPEVVKAVAEQESGWKQFDDNGQPVSSNGGIGIMQITNQPSYDQDSLKNDIYYNIQAGVQILSSMYDRKDLPKIKGAGRDVIENWYFPVMAYNGTKPQNSPLVQASGAPNTKAYQEQVFAKIEDESFLDDTPLAQFPFTTADFVYSTSGTDNITFKKLEYTITDQMHASRYYFKTGDNVVTSDSVKLRSQPNTTSSYVSILKNTPLIIKGGVNYDPSSSNKFVWYPVTTIDGTKGFISSAYITKKTGWLQYNNSWYYFGPNGNMLTGWVKDGRDWYYMASSGKMLTGWVKDGRDWYYMASSGKMLTGWVKDGRDWYYMASTGKMQTGWVKSGQDWYYMASSGKMQTGWQKVGGKWYYLYSNGKMAHDTKIGNYKLSHSGARI